MNAKIAFSIKKINNIYLKVFNTNGFISLLNRKFKIFIFISGQGKKNFKNSIKFDAKLSLGIIENQRNAVIEYMF